MKFKNQGVKCLSAAILILPCILSNTAQADLSYGAKFVLTTAAGCTAGGIGTGIYASQAGYDTQPRATVTWMGAATGCLTGAVFSYFFYNDESGSLQTRISEQQKTIQDLSLQLASMQGQKQNGTFSSDQVYRSLPNPFDNLELKEGIAKSTYDPNHLPKGLNIKTCSHLWQYSLINDGSDVVSTTNSNSRIVAVSKNFALVGFAFLYSPNDCFSPSTENGFYAEKYFPGLENFLINRVRNWKLENEK